MTVRLLPTDTVSDLQSRLLTYPEHGATATATSTPGALPAGYQHIRRTTTIGAGSDVFDAAAGDLLRFQVQLRAGVRIAASSERVAEGVVLVQGLGVGPLRVSAPARVVWAVHEARRAGFAYGTLPGHPESGEEAFVLEHGADDAVRFSVVAFSRPATLLARAGGPVAALVQRFVTNRYLHALDERVRAQVAGP